MLHSYIVRLGVVQLYWRTVLVPYIPILDNPHFLFTGTWILIAMTSLIVQVVTRDNLKSFGIVDRRPTKHHLLHKHRIQSIEHSKAQRSTFSGDTMTPSVPSTSSTSDDSTSATFRAKVNFMKFWKPENPPSVRLIERYRTYLVRVWYLLF